MKNKIMYPTIFIVTFLVVIFIILLTINYYNKQNRHKSFINEDGILQEELLSFDKVDILKKNIDLSVENITIYTVEDSLKIVTKLKNTSGKIINGFYINIEFLDRSENVLFPASYNTTQLVPPNEIIEIENYASLSEKYKKVSNVRILNLEKNIGESSNEMFDSLESK